MKDRYKQLSSDEASRALYVDFERSQGSPPILLGRTRRTQPTKVWQVITDDGFNSIGTAESVPVMSLSEAVGSLVAMANRRDRRIVAWTEHELNVVRDYCPEHYEGFEASFTNARAFAERWRNKCHGRDKPSTGHLSLYLRLIGYRNSPEAGPDEVGNTIRALRKPLANGKSYHQLTANQKRRWTTHRDHNRHDCTGIRTVCHRAAKEIDSYQRSAG